MLRRLFEEGRTGTLSRERLAMNIYMMVRGLNVPEELKKEVLAMLVEAIETRLRTLRLEDETALMAELEKELGLPIPFTRQQQVEAVKRVIRRLRDILEEERRREEVEGGSQGAI